MDRVRATLRYINGASGCFGCGACVAACPKSAIRMERDDDGFTYPRIDLTACVKCGRCRRVCPVNAERQTAEEGFPKFFSLRHRDAAVRRVSTSGGVFTAVSDAVLARGGAVAGAVMTAELRARHAVACDAAGRDAMRGSKYIQSDASAVFREVRHLLDSGREVLFSGTPCQVAALYSFLGGRPEGLTTVDFICHGVPSPLVFEGYLRHLEKLYGSAATRVRFRDQSRGCVPMRIGVDFAGGRNHLGDCDSDPFFKVFLSGIANRPCCTVCPFTRVSRGSDLTMADNWRFAAIAPEWDDNTGVSTLLVNTQRGAELLREAEMFMELKPCTLKDIDQHYLHHPGGENPDRGLFFKALRRHGFARAAADFTGPRPLLRRLRSRVSKILRVLCGKKRKGCGI